MHASPNSAPKPSAVFFAFMKTGFLPFLTLTRMSLFLPVSSSSTVVFAMHSPLIRISAPRESLAETVTLISRSDKIYISAYA